MTAPAPPAGELFGSGTVTADASYQWRRCDRKDSVPVSVTTTSPVQAPWKTYSSATDAPAAFGQSGQQFAIEGAGADLYSGTDAYSSIYQPGVVGAAATVETEVTAQQNMTGYAKAGIMVRNDITGSGTSPEGVILFESPSGGIQLEWDNNGGDFINSVTPANGTIPESLPVYLELVRNGSTYTGYYSYDGSVLAGGGQRHADRAGGHPGRRDVPHLARGGPARARRRSTGSASPASAATPPLATSYEAEAAANTIAGGAGATACSTCSGGEKVGFVGEGGTLTFNDVSVPSAGTYQVTIGYLDGSATGRPADVTANGGTPQPIQFTPTGSFSAVGTMTIPLTLTAGEQHDRVQRPVRLRTRLRPHHRRRRTQLLGAAASVAVALRVLPSAVHFISAVPYGPYRVP